MAIKKLTQRPNRYSLTLSAKYAASVRAEAAARSISMQALIESCVANRYDPEHAERDTHLIMREIKGLRREVARVDFELKVLVEALTIGLRNIMAVQRKPTPEDKLQGARFYDQLVSTIEKVFESNKALIDQLANSLLKFSDEDFATLPDDKDASDATPGAAP